MIGVVTGVTGYYAEGDFSGHAWFTQGLIVSFPPDCWIAFTDENPLHLKLSDNWKDDFDPKKETDYLVEISIVRANGLIWMAHVMRSRLAARPQLVIEEIK